MRISGYEDVITPSEGIKACDSRELGSIATKQEYPASGRQTGPLWAVPGHNV